MNPKRLVSVIVPCFNQARFLPDAIDSLRNQACADWECIIVDDGSTDDTPIVAARLAELDSRVRWIRQENRGLAGARNTGLRMARGTHIQFLDADDLLFPTKFETQLLAIAGDDRPAVSYCRVFYCLGTRVSHEVSKDKPFSLLDEQNPLLDIINRWELGLSIPCHCFLFDARLFDSLIFDESLPNHEDWECWMRVFERHPRVCFVDEKLAIYRRHEESMCRDEARMRAGFIQAVMVRLSANLDNLSVRWALGNRLRALDNPLPDTVDRVPANPLVTVIVSSYNYEKYVVQALNSVFSQTYRNVELIVVDDGSQDNSVAAIRETLRHCPFPHELIVKENGGQSSSFNAGFSKARGAVVAFLDSDDFWYPDRLEKVVDYMGLFPGGAIYQHQLDTGKGLKRNSHMSADVFPLWCQWNNGTFNLSDDHDGLFFAPFVPTSGLTFPRSVLDKVFPIPSQLITCPDAFLTRTSAAYGPLISIPAPLGVWRDHGENAGRTGKATFEGYWLPVIMPALNAYYESHELPLRLEYNPATRSQTPAGRILGEGVGVRTFRVQSASSQNVRFVRRSRTGHIIASMLRLILPAAMVEDIRRFVRREPPRGGASKSMISTSRGHQIANWLRGFLPERRVQQLRRFIRRR